jgi:hypothetical protein
METREPGQVRKEAALSGHLQALRERRTGVRNDGRASVTGFDGGCTVHLVPLARGEPTVCLWAAVVEVAGWGAFGEGDRAPPLRGFRGDWLGSGAPPGPGPEASSCLSHL